MQENKTIALEDVESVVCKMAKLESNWDRPWSVFLV